MGFKAVAGCCTDGLVPQRRDIQSQCRDRNTVAICDLLASALEGNLFNI